MLCLLWEEVGVCEEVLSRSLDGVFATERKSLEDLEGSGCENLLEFNWSSGIRGDFGGNLGELGISGISLQSNEIC